ncbi:MAG TPA: trehalose-6-phosphate synthase [Hyphomicrobiaceae bacterium]|nr:trehalose-6-phosphate synthase [Hyphomicrobiaceae bacterium]
MSRLVIISNRVALAEKGKQAGGGLVTGVLDALREIGGIWFGWSGETAGTGSARPKVTEADGVTYATVNFAREDYEGYYNGFCNATLWPLFHYRLDLVEFTRRDFAAYQRVNTLLADQLAPMLLPDDLIWVHDYHLIPMAENLRRAGATQRIGFFLHTPFPSFGVLTVLPHYESLLESLCAYDLIGFQTIDDLTAFHDALIRGGSGEILTHGRVRAFGRTTRAGVFPIGVDTDAIAEMAAPGVRSRTLRRFEHSLRDQPLIIGVDRLDYSKGLEHRFKAFASFLERYPENRGRVSFLQIATATRSNVPEYRALRQRLGSLAGDIAGRFSELDWTPIQYLNRSFSHRSLCGFFRLSRIALVTPLRDGMNLVAKEYVAAQDPSDPGVLILSPFAGAAYELTSAVMANPYDPDAVAEALQMAMQMPLEERCERWRAMMEVLRRNDVTAWRKSFLRSLGERSFSTV